MHTPIPHAPSYDNLVDRLNRSPQGAPRSESLYRILEILFSSREAELVAMLPIKPFTVDKASKVWKMELSESQKALDSLASRAILVDVEQPDGKVLYTLPPPMAGFFEFSMMRTRGDIDQKMLGELFYQYCNVEEDFIGALFANGETQLGRVYVNETALPEVHVLDYERASEIIKTATHRGISMCYCRHKMEIMEQSCNAPMNICMTFNASAQALTRAEFAREVDVAEGLDLLQEAYDHNLVQFGENVREKVNFICNCCGCCCEAMIAARRFAVDRPIHTSNFLPDVHAEECTGCGKCVDACPVEAMTLVSANDPDKPKKKMAVLSEDICLGCGVCVRTCEKGYIGLTERAERVITPINSVHRTVMMAIERGTFQNLLFDNQALWNHRAMAAVLGAVFRLPPVKQVMASQQVKSRYMEALIGRLYSR
jgi:Na+-translocating ferredoxin:NAD+ oxidoreductase RNF subunit RnfB